MERRGVTLLLVVLVLSALLAISISIFSLVFGEFRISGEISDSFVAFYAADRGMEKLLYMDRVADSVPGCGGSGACQWPQPPDSPASFNLENGACFRLLYRRLGNGDAIAIAGGEYRCGIPALSVQRAAEMTYNKSGGGGVVEFGDGRDIFVGSASPGFININRVSTISGRTEADAVNFSVTRSLNTGETDIRLDVDPNGIADGDEVLIINLQGRPGATADIGLFETQRVDRVTGRTIRLRAGLTNSYDGTVDKIMIQRVPNYNTMSIPSFQQFGADAWNSALGIGGVFFIRVNGLLNISGPNGEITGTGRGYRGGASVEQGESIAGAGASGERAANLGGGGAGTGRFSGGGGGGYGAAGGNGDTGDAFGPGFPADAYGFGGSSYGGDLNQFLFLGSGGGGGGPDFFACEEYSYRGTNGGGIVAVFAKEISNGGKIVADGETILGAPVANGGGGGSGGSLVVKTNNFFFRGTLGAAGGSESINYGGLCWGFPFWGQGGNGGAGVSSVP